MTKIVQQKKGYNPLNLIVHSLSLWLGLQVQAFER